MSAAPGSPGRSPTWRTSAKEVVGCARIDPTFRSGTRWVGMDFRVQVVPRTRQQG